MRGVAGWAVTNGATSHGSVSRNVASAEVAGRVQRYTDDELRRVGLDLLSAASSPVTRLARGDRQRP